VFLSLKACLFVGFLILANSVPKFICFIQERKKPSEKNIAEY
jgi:hypothetical protein